MKCPERGGTGYISVPPVDLHGMLSCEACNGTGEVPDGKSTANLDNVSSSLVVGEAKESGARLHSELLVALQAQANCMRDEDRSLYQCDIEEAIEIITRDDEALEALRKLVENAYREGYEMGVLEFYDFDRDGMPIVKQSTFDAEWKDSDAYAIITRAEAALPKEGE